MDEYSDLEQRAVDLIRENNEVLQSDLWKELECSAGRGSEIARTLEEDGIVNRKRVTANGSSTYMLEAERKDTEDLDFTLLLAGDRLPPFIGNEDVEYDDDRFTQWIQNLQKDYELDI